MKLDIYTERLLLTPFALTNFDFSLKLWTDPQVAKYIGEVPTEAEHRKEMPDAIKRGGNGGIGIWCISDLKTGENLGEAYLLPRPVDQEDNDFSLVVMGQMPDADIEIGYFFLPSAWGRGYATEVCQRMLKFAFQEVLLDEVVASVEEANLASRKVLEKSGLFDCGRTRSYGKINPIYRITRDQWNTSQQ
jgi:ribosomal-protein-alanine N-acetyltransferase